MEPKGEKKGHAAVLPISADRQWSGSRSVAMAAALGLGYMPHTPRLIWRGGLRREIAFALLAITFFVRSFAVL